MRKTESLAVHTLRLLLVFALAAAGPPAAADALRLGDAVVPTFEAVHLTLDPDRTDYRGRVAVELQVRETTSTFRFHADGMELEDVRLAGEAGDVEVEHAAGEHGIVTLASARPLAPGAYRLSVAFRNQFNTRAVSLYRMELDGSGYLFTQFQPDEARRAFPCWDEPGFKIPFRLTVEVPERHTVISNTPVEREALAEGWKTVEFRRTKPLPTYLVALAVGPFETVPIAGLSVPGRVVTVRGQSGLAGLAAEIAPAVLRAAEAYFGTPYPYEKLDLLAVPEYWAGAMEHPGAVTYSDRVLLLDAATASAAERRRLVGITAHELAHMWFGNLVTMRWWDDLWLNESFADWMGDKITHELEPRLELDLVERIGLQQTMAFDAHPSSEPIHRPVAATDNLFQNVGIAYDKGKAVLAMFEHWIGPERFRDGVRAYLRAHAWGNAEAADLWRALSRVGGADVAAAMATFIDQPGFPLVRVELAAEDPAGIVLTQRRFLNAGAQAEALAWKVPVGLKVYDGDRIEQRSLLLDGPRHVLRLAAERPARWVLPNAGARGYYRWSVPAAMLQRLAADAREWLEPAERIGLVGNLTALLEGGELGGDDYLRLLGPLAADDEPLVVSAVVDALGKVEDAFVLRPDQERAFASYLRETLTPALERIGLDPRPGERDAAALLRPRLFRLLGGQGRDPVVIRKATELARRYLDDPTSIDSSLAGVALALRARDGGRELFELYRKRFEAAKAPAERERFLASLGQFRDPALRERALAYVLEGPLRPNELFTIQRAMTDTESGRQRIYDWMKQHYDDVAARVPPMFLSFLPFAASGCSADRLADAERFFAEPKHQAPGTLTQLSKVSDQVNECVRLRSREGAAVDAFLAAPRRGAPAAAPTP